MNPHTNHPSSTQNEESLPEKGLDGVSVKVVKQAAPMAGGGSALDKYLGKPEQIQKIKTPLIAALVALAVLDLFFHGEHATFLWDSIPGFSALYGLIATVLIIFVSKFLGLGLMKREDYYN